MRRRKSTGGRADVAAFEQYLCPYYTQAFGPFIPTLTEALPHEPAKAWQHAPEPVLDWMRYMNERASDMFAGSPEYVRIFLHRLQGQTCDKC